MELHLPVHDNLFLWLFNSKCSFGVVYLKKMESPECMKQKLLKIEGFQRKILSRKSKIINKNLRKKLKIWFSQLDPDKRSYCFWFFVMVLPLLCNHTNLDTVSCQIPWICSSTQGSIFLLKFDFCSPQCFGSISFWCGSGSGSADPLPGWWIRIRVRF